MRHLNLDTADPAALEAALDAAPPHTAARVTVADGEVLTAFRVPGGWYLPGDLAVASADVAEGRPLAVTLDVPEGRADALALLAEAQRAEYPSPREAVDLARALLAAGDRDCAEAATAELDDLASVGHAEAGALRDEIRAWLAGSDGDVQPEGDHR